MKMLLLVIMLFVFSSCLVKENESLQGPPHYSDDYVLIEFASKLEEAEMQEKVNNDHNN